MLFAHTWEKVLSGEKTQTRRIVKPGDHLSYWPSYWANYRAVYNLNVNGVPVDPSESDGRLRWRLYQVLTVQPGRTRKGVAQIRITDLRREDARNISPGDVRQEGFLFKADFLNAWTQMHDNPAHQHLMSDLLAREYQRQGLPVPEWVWADWLAYLNTRPAERYDCWAITFERVTAQHLEAAPVAG